MTAPSSPKPSVLVIRGGAIGDFIVTLPAMRLLKESIPGCRLDVLGYSGICELAVAAGLADTAWHLDHRSMAMLFAPGAPVDAEVGQRLKSYSLVISYLYDPDGYFRGNLERIGVKTLIECPHKVADGAGPAPVQLARPLERLAMFLEDPVPRFPCSGARGGPLQVVLHPGSGSLQKNWAVSNWRTVAERLAAGFPDLRWTLVTGEAEAERGQTAEAIADWPGPPVGHWESVPLPELVSRFDRTRGVFLGHDSGISHLAAACGLPCFLIFGPTDPSVWAPQNAGVEIFHRRGEALADVAPDEVLGHMVPWIEGRIKEMSSGL